jgi:hypothetical protein
MFNVEKTYMKKSFVICAAFVVASLAATGPSFAQNPGAQPLPAVILRDDGKAITPQQKAQSDQLMAAGLTSLQSAASALQSGNTQGAISYLQSAYSSMLQAEPIYHGYRERALKNTKEAGLELERNRRESVQRASGRITQAISDAQTAVNRW